MSDGRSSEGNCNRRARHYAAPQPGASQWYQPVENVPATEGFIAKLNDALQKRAQRLGVGHTAARASKVFIGLATIAGLPARRRQPSCEAMCSTCGMRVGVVTLS